MAYYTLRLPSSSENQARGRINLARRKKKRSAPAALIREEPLSIWVPDDTPDQQRIRVALGHMEDLSAGHIFGRSWTCAHSIKVKVKEGTNKAALLLEILVEMSYPRKVINGRHYEIATRHTEFLSMLLPILTNKKLITLAQLNTHSAKLQVVQADVKIDPNPIYDEKAQLSRTLDKSGDRTQPTPFNSELSKPELVDDSIPIRQGLIDGGQFVYVMSNPDSKYLKIGQSQDPDERVKTLRNTNSPFDNKVEYFIETDDALRLEKLVHTALKNKRVARDREWFDTELPEAIDTIRQLALKTGLGPETIRANTIDGLIPTRQQWETHRTKLKEEARKAAEERVKEQEAQRLFEQQLTEEYERYREQLFRKCENDHELNALRKQRSSLVIFALVGLGLGLGLALTVGDLPLLPLGFVVAIIFVWLGTRIDSKIDEKLAKYQPMPKAEFAEKYNCQL